MLDLSYLGQSPGVEMVDSPPPGAGPGDLNDEYARYRTRLVAQDPAALPMSAADFERYSLGSGWLNNVRHVAKRVVQTCRLMIGIHDYEYYLDHMRSRHPEATPMTREDFYRYCLEAHYPSAARIGGRCPC